MATIRRFLFLPVSFSPANGKAKPAKFEPPPMQPPSTSASSSARSSCFLVSSPITVWCMSTWLSTLPSEYLVSSRVAASSTASLIAMPRLPGEPGSPLAGAGLGGQARDLLHLVVVGLGRRGVELVAARRARALVLVVDARGGVEGLLESPRTVERGRAPQAEHVAHLVRDLDPPLLADLLLDQLHREERGQIL